MMNAMRRFTAALAVVLTGVMAALIGSVFTAPAASAHNVLVSSDPVDGADVAASLAKVTFTFDQPVQNFDPVIAVTGPDGQQYQTGEAQVSGNSVSSAVALGPAGKYIASYRIISADGHPVTGQIAFASAAAGTATGKAPPNGAVTASSTDSSGGLPTWIWIALAGAAVVIAAAVVLLLRKPRQPD